MFGLTSGLALVFSFALAATAHASGPSISGIWQLSKGGRPIAWVRIFERGDIVEGVVARTFRPDGRPSNELCSKCNGERKSGPITGMTIIRNMHKEGQEYTGGRIENPFDGRIYGAKLTMSADGQSLMVKSSRKKLGGSERWQRVSSSMAALESVVVKPTVDTVIRPGQKGDASSIFDRLFNSAEKNSGQILASASPPPEDDRPASNKSVAKAKTSSITKPPRAGYVIAADEARVRAAGSSFELASTTAPVEIEIECRAKQRQAGIVSAEPCVDFDEIFEKLRNGAYSFNKPDTAFVGSPLTIALVLQPSGSNRIDDAFNGLPGSVERKEAKFARTVEAHLSAPDFKIEPSGPQSRTVTTSENVEWLWQATPLSGGQKRLTIVVNAIIQIGKEKHTVQVQTLRQDIVINVSIYQQIKLYVAEANSVVLGAAAAIPAIGAIVALFPRFAKFINSFIGRRKRRSDPGQSDAPPIPDRD